MFGAGLSRDVEGLAAETLRAASRVLAVDVPSGVDGADGRVRGYAPQAELTVTFFRRKPGHLLLPGRDLCGECVLADIGLPARVLDELSPNTFANGPALWTLPSLAASGHKYTRGHVTVLGGAMTGAARLAADAARHAGAGMVTIAALSHADIYRTGPAGLIVSEAGLAELLADKRREVWVCGPGLGPDNAAKALPALIAAGRKVVADADSFSAFADDPDALRGAAVLTPHEGEFARVFGKPGPDRLAAARRAAARTGAVLLLKGSDTDHRRPGRPRRDQQLGAALPRDGRRRRRARRHHRRPARAGDGAVACRRRWRIPARPRRRARRPGPGCRGPDSRAARGDGRLRS